MDYMKKIIIYNCNINKLYEFNEKLQLINYIKPSNLLIMNISYLINCLYITENKLEYSLYDIHDKLNINEINNIIEKIYNTIYRLNQLNINHNNLKLNNILFDKEFNIYLSHYCINDIRSIENYYVNNDIENLCKIENVILKKYNNNEKCSISHFYKLKNNNSINDITLIIYNDVKSNKYEIVETLINQMHLSSYNKIPCLFYCINHFWENQWDLKKLLSIDTFMNIVNKNYAIKFTSILYYLEDYNRYKIDTLISGIMFLKNIKILSFYSIPKN